jgi:hypothetical protein
MKHAVWLAAMLLSCASDDAPANQLRGVRILATSADKPFAKPGESVTLNVLAVDGRQARTAPMRTFFFPELCANPERDDAQKCFATLARAYPLRTNLDAELKQGASAEMVLPGDIIAAHAEVRGGEPYGIAFAFVMACAGHVERALPSDGFPGAPPFGCFDAQGQLLGKDDYVFAHVRILSYAALRNANPVLESVSLGGNVIGQNGFSLTRCAEGDERNCAKAAIDVQLTEDSQEPDLTSGPPGAGFREQVWVSYFVTAGKMESDLSIIFDPQEGKLPKTANGLFTKDGAGAQTLYAVAHDNRGGVSWRQVSFTIQ